MFKHKNNNKNIILSLLTFVFCTACASTSEVNQLEQPNNLPEYVSITALELAQLKDAAMQWQQARAGLERILRLEKEITYLVDHIDIINTKAITQSNQRYTRADTRNPTAAHTIKALSKAPKHSYSKKRAVKLNTLKHSFSLQVASVSSEPSLKKVWQNLNIQAAPLFRKKIETNVEQIRINDKIFYRLKLGSYQKLNNAKADCEVFKLYKLDCIVSSYTDKPIKL